MSELHTEATWEIERQEADGSIWIVGSDGETIAEVCTGDIMDEETVETNARLIAAAPAMHAALAFLSSILPPCNLSKGVSGIEYHVLRDGTLGHTGERCTACIVRAALADAEGRTP